MNCRSSEERFERFLDGELAARERAELIAHVDACAGCRSILEELRVVDALLLEPRAVQLVPNFTYVTMAEVRALDAPRRMRAPITAYAVSYLVAAWSIVAVTYLLSPGVMHMIAAMAFDFSASMSSALTELAHVFGRSFGHDASAMPTVVGGLVVLDIALVAAFALAFVYVRPRLVKRLRS